MRKKSIIIGVFLFLYDQIIKHVIDARFFVGKNVSVINNFFYISKVYNDGAAWSFFSGDRTFLIIVSILALIFLIMLEKEFENNTKTSMAFGFIYGGLFGNMFDRIFYGYVIDYFKMIFGSYTFPIFNLADVAIVIGFLILIICIIKGEIRHDSKKHK